MQRVVVGLNVGVELSPGVSVVAMTALIENPRLCSPKFLTCEQRSV